MHRIIVLGSGMVGSAAAIDLAQQHSVTLADINETALTRAKKKFPGIATLVLNVRDQEALRSAIAPFDLVVCAVPGFLGYETLKAVIAAKKNIVDFSFFAEDALTLDALAKQNGVTAVVDCGVAPGMHNIIVGYHNARMTVTDFECLVGGLPKVKRWPFYYKAPFSPVDVIEEYTRPARFVENGHEVVREALSDCEYIEFDRVGTLEAFNTDGLRSLIKTMPHIPNMKEKTLRYPGHVEMVRALKASGFFSTTPLSVDGQSIVPLHVTSKVLFSEWKLGDTEPEITVMRVTIKGKDANGIAQKIVYHLYDEFDAATGTSSMARTTGYTATAVANLVLNGTFAERGVFPPELVGKHEVCFHAILHYLAERNVRYITE